MLLGYQGMLPQLSKGPQDIQPYPNGKHLSIVLCSSFANNVLLAVKEPRFNTYYYPLDFHHYPHPPQVLVKKSYGDKVKRSKQRNWQLQMIDREMDVTVAMTNEKGAEEDYEEFLEDLEEDMIYCKNINIFFSEFFTLYHSFSEFYTPQACVSP